MRTTRLGIHVLIVVLVLTLPPRTVAEPAPMQAVQWAEIDEPAYAAYLAQVTFARPLTFDLLRSGRLASDPSATDARRMPPRQDAPDPADTSATDARRLAPRQDAPDPADTSATDARMWPPRQDGAVLADTWTGTSVIMLGFLRPLATAGSTGSGSAVPAADHEADHDHAHPAISRVRDPIAPAAAALDGHRRFALLPGVSLTPDLSSESRQPWLEVETEGIETLAAFRVYQVSGDLFPPGSGAGELCLGRIQARFAEPQSERKIRLAPPPPPFVAGTATFPWTDLEPLYNPDAATLFADASLPASLQALEGKPVVIGGHFPGGVTPAGALELRNFVADTSPEEHWRIIIQPGPTNSCTLRPASALSPFLFDGRFYGKLRLLPQDRWLEEGMFAIDDAWLVGLEP